MHCKTEILGAIIVSALVQFLAGCIEQGGGVAPPGPVEQRAGDRQETAPIRKPSIADREGWSPDGFFTSPNELRICRLISSGDMDRLAALLDSGVELNTPGKFGFTVLYWAYVEDDMEAFELLLKHGADPDRRLTETFRWSSDGPVDSSKEPQLSHYLPFPKGDSILFTSLWHSRHNYCFAALPYSAKGEQFSRGSETLMHRFLQYGLGYESGLKQLIDAGVDLNARGQFGLTPSFMALNTSPSLCLQLLEAGADPRIKAPSGNDLADTLERRLTHLRPGERADAYEPLIKWLEANYREIHWTKSQAAESGDP